MATMYSKISEDVAIQILAEVDKIYPEEGDVPPMLTWRRLGLELGESLNLNVVANESRGDLLIYGLRVLEVAYLLGTSLLILCTQWC